MLTVAEREVAIRALALTIMGAASQRTAVVAMVADAEFGLTLSFSPQNALELARAAIELCVTTSWNRVPPWLQQVLSKVTQTPEIAELLEKIGTPPANWQPASAETPFDAVWLPHTREPFVNRRRLREHLRRLADSEGPSVLVINGREKLGKSYSVQLLDHVVREQLPADRRDQLLPIGLVPLQRGMGASLTPEALARLIASRIVTDPSPPAVGSVTPDRANEQLVDWIVELAETSGRSWWIVLDGLEDRDLPLGTRQFVSKLVELLSIGKHRKRLRVLIIDYPVDVLAGVLPSEMGTEDLGPIGEIDLEPFFQRLLQRPGAPPPDPMAVRMAVTLAMAELPDDGRRYKSLNDRLKKVAANV